MKKILCISSFICLLFMGCSEEPVTPPLGKNGCGVIPSESITAISTKEFDQDLLRRLSEAVYFESGSNSCQSDDMWGIAGFGAKPCGGPAGYIAYKKPNEQCFLKVLERYNQQSQLFNLKYQIISNCLVEPAPKSVVCEDGKPILLY
jgi:hypothetical protein